MKKIMLGLLLLTSLSSNAQGLQVVYEAKNVRLLGIAGQHSAYYLVSKSSGILQTDYVLITDVSRNAPTGINYSPIQVLGITPYDGNTFAINMSIVYEYVPTYSPYVNILVLRTTP
jgi:hypothetical protein